MSRNEREGRKYPSNDLIFYLVKNFVPKQMNTELWRREDNFIVWTRSKYEIG